MAEHAHTTPSRAVRTPDNPRGRTAAADWPQPITAADRARIANDVELLIAFLVAIATPMAQAGA